MPKATKKDLQLMKDRIAESRRRTDEVRDNLLGLSAGIVLKNTYRPDRSTNFLHMGVCDVGISLNDSKTAKLVGEVTGNMGGSVTISDKARDEEWTLSFFDLWNAYKGARAALGELPPLPKGQEKPIIKTIKKVAKEIVRAVRKGS